MTEWAVSLFPCRYCDGQVLTRIWQAPSGAYERVYLRCDDCNVDWYINGKPLDGEA